MKILYIGDIIARIGSAVSEVLTLGLPDGDGTIEDFEKIDIRVCKIVK